MLQDLNYIDETMQPTLTAIKNLQKQVDYLDSHKANCVNICGCNCDGNIVFDIDHDGNETITGVRNFAQPINGYTNVECAITDLLGSGGGDLATKICTNEVDDDTCYCLPLIPPNEDGQYHNVFTNAGLYYNPDGHDLYVEGGVCTYNVCAYQMYCVCKIRSNSITVVNDNDSILGSIGSYGISSYNGNFSCVCSGFIYNMSTLRSKDSNFVFEDCNGDEIGGIYNGNDLCFPRGYFNNISASGTVCADCGVFNNVQLGNIDLGTGKVCYTSDKSLFIGDATCYTGCNNVVLGNNTNNCAKVENTFLSNSCLYNTGCGFCNGFFVCSNVCAPVLSCAASDTTYDGCTILINDSKQRYVYDNGSGSKMCMDMSIGLSRVFDVFKFDFKKTSKAEVYNGLSCIAYRKSHSIGEILTYGATGTVTDYTDLGARTTKAVNTFTFGFDAVYPGTLLTCRWVSIGYTDGTHATYYMNDNTTITTSDGVTPACICGTLGIIW